MLLALLVAAQINTTQPYWKEVVDSIQTPIVDVERLQLNGLHSERQKAIMDMAWDICGQDNNFLVLLKGENGIITHDRKMGPNKNGTYDYGYCGVNTVHKDILNEKFFTEPLYQLKECCNLYKAQGLKIFYAVDTKWERDKIIKNHFVWEKTLTPTK